MADGGGWGVTGPNSSSNNNNGTGNKIKEPITPTVSAGGSGTYHDPAGNPITREQFNAQSQPAQPQQPSPGQISGQQTQGQATINPYKPPTIGQAPSPEYLSTLPPAAPAHDPRLLSYYPPQPGSPADMAGKNQFIEGSPKLKTGKAEIESYTTYKSTVALMGLSEAGQTGFENMIGATPESGGVKGFVAGAASVVTGTPALVGESAFALEALARQPTQAAAGIPAGASKLLDGMKTQATENPARFAGSIAGMALMAKAGSLKSPVKGVTIEAAAPKGFPAIEPDPLALLQAQARQPITGKLQFSADPRYTGAIAQMRGTSPAPVVAAAGAGLVYQGITAEAGRKAQPIIGITEAPVSNYLSAKLGSKTLVIGTPEFTPAGRAAVYGGGSNLDIGTFESTSGIRDFSNPTAQKIATDNILKTYDPATQDLFRQTIEKRELTYGTPATHKLSDVPLEEVITGRHGLKPETAQNVRAYMETQSQQGDLILWGSTANKAAVMGPGGVGYFRELGDIDIHVRNPAAASQELFNIISKTEAPGTVTLEGTGISTRKGHIFDVKDIQGQAPGTPAGSGPVGSSTFGFKAEAPEQIGKFKTVSLSEQTTNKLSSIALRENTISAAAHRAGKDPFDLVYINEPAQTLGLEQSWNPYTRYIKAPKAKALDAAIQEKTWAKIQSQPVGSGPGQITAQQKELFFKNVDAMKAGQPVATTPEPTLLYRSPSLTPEASLGAARQAAYISASAYAARAPYGEISQVTPPHSPANVQTPEGGRGAQDIARQIADEINKGSPEGSQQARAKGPDIYTPSGDKLIKIEYFNRGKIDAAPAVVYDKSFGSESLTGSPKNALSSNYYGSLNAVSSMSGGDAGTYTPQNPYYDVPGTYPSSPGYGQPKQSPPNYPGYSSPRGSGRVSSGGLTPRTPAGFKYPIPTKKKNPDEKKSKKAKSKTKGSSFNTYRASPIADATANLKDLKKSMGIITRKRGSKK